MHQTPQGGTWLFCFQSAEDQTYREFLAKRKDQSNFILITGIHNLLAFRKIRIGIGTIQCDKNLNRYWEKLHFY